MTGLRLKELTSKITFNKIHNSTMIRAIETADIIKKHLPDDIISTTDPLLSEGF